MPPRGLTKVTKSLVLHLKSPVKSFSPTKSPPTPSFFFNLFLDKMFIYNYNFCFCPQFDADNMYMNDSNQDFRNPNQVRQPPFFQS